MTTVLPVGGGGTIVLDPVTTPPPQVESGRIQLIPWGSILHDLAQNLEEFFGLDQGPTPVDNTDTIIPNIITALHFNNRSISALQLAVQWLIAYDRQLEASFTTEQFTVAGFVLWAQAQITGIENGTITVPGAVTTADLETLRAQIDGLVVPLTENLGQLTTQLESLRQQVLNLEAQLARENLNARVANLETFNFDTVAPLLIPLVAIIGANVVTRLATVEDCCAANNGFRNEFQDLLKAIKPLLTLLKALEALDLAALAAAIFAEGLPAAARQIGQIAEDHFASAESDLASFLGL